MRQRALKIRTAVSQEVPVVHGLELGAKMYGHELIPSLREDLKPQAPDN